MNIIDKLIKPMIRLYRWVRYREWHAEMSKPGDPWSIPATTVREIAGLTPQEWKTLKRLERKNLGRNSK